MFDPCLYYNISVLNRIISKIWQEEFQKLNLPPSHGYLLFALFKDKSLTQKDLSELLQLDPSTTTRFVDSLIKKDLLEKQGKGKGSSLLITGKGKKLALKINNSMNKLYKKMQSTIGPDKFEGIGNQLKDLRETFKE